MHPANDRVGRMMADGRFEVVEWLEAEPWMSVSIALDQRDGSLVQLTTAGDVDATLEELEQWLMRDVEGLAPVLYLGPVNSDDRWAAGYLLMAERLPRGTRLAELVGPMSDGEVARIARLLVASVQRIHQQGAVAGTLHPELAHIDGERVTWVARGPRLWLMPRPNRTKPGSVQPWRPGYRAPELFASGRHLDDPAPSADVFTLGVILSELLLGQLPYEAEASMALFVAQSRGEHVPLPETALGRMLARLLAPKPEERPVLDEVVDTLAAIK